MSNQGTQRKWSFIGCEIKTHENASLLLLKKISIKEGEDIMVDKKVEPILITDATDNHEGKVMQNLLRNIRTMQIFNRNSSKPMAQTVVKKIGQIAKPDTNDRAYENKALQEILRTVHVGTFKKHSPVRETRHGKILANAAKAARIKYFIRRSFGDAERSAVIPHTKNTWNIGQYMRFWLACNHFPSGSFRA